MNVAHWLRLPLALALALGLTAPAEAQLWKPTKKKPAAATKAKSAPVARKASTPTKRKAKPRRARPRVAPARSDDDPQLTTGSAEFDDAPIITITDGDGRE